MNTSTRNMLSSLVVMAGKFCMGVGGMLFFFGGRAFHEFASVQRGLAELIGLGLAMVCVLVGVVIKGWGENLEVPEEIEDSDSGDGPESGSDKG